MEMIDAVQCCCQLHLFFVFINVNQSQSVEGHLVNAICAADVALAVPVFSLLSEL